MKKQTLRFTLFLLICLSLPLAVTAEIINIPEPVPPPFAVREAFELDPFYQQWIDVEGLPVVASEKVNPYAVKEAAWLIRQMIGHRPAVLWTMANNNVRFAIMAHDEMTTDIPEHSSLRPDFYWDKRARGLGATPVRPAVSCGEENLLNYPGDPYWNENILIHEFSHALHQMGLNTVDPDFDNRLKSTFETAKKSKLWEGTYASTNKEEYWAEGVQSWFNTNRENDAEHNNVNTRTELKNYDTALATLLNEVFGDTDGRYTPATTRTHLPHLQGFNLQDFPMFEWPPELAKLDQELRNPDSDGNGKWVNLNRYHPSQLSRLKSSDEVASTEIIFVNNSIAEFSFYRVDSDGKETYFGRVPIKAYNIQYTYAGHIWLVKDQNGKNLAVFQAEEKTGRAYIDVQVLQPPTPGMTVVDIPDPNLRAAVEKALGVASGATITVTNMANLTILDAPNADIADLSGLETATNLTQLGLWNNSISDISPVAGLTNLTSLRLWDNSISDISPVVRLTNLTELFLGDNSISDISPVAGLTNLIILTLSGNSISDISPVAGLINLIELSLENNSISDISPLVANAGLGSGDTVRLRGNPLSYQSIHTHIPTLQSKGVTVEFDNRTPTPPLKISGDNQQGTPGAALDRPFVVEVQDGTSTPFEGVPVIFTVTAGGGTVQPETVLTDENGRAEGTLTFGLKAATNTVHASVEGISEPATFNAIAKIEFDLSIPSNISLIHVPLKVTAVDGAVQTIESIADLYDALGGTSKVTFLITYDSQAQEWRSYFGASDKGTPADRTLTDDIGIIAGMIAPTSVRLSGNPLGTDGSSIITVNPGLNLVGLPLRDSRINRVSDLFTLDGIGGNVPVIILTDDGEFKVVGQAGDPGDVPIRGGQAFILTAQRAETVALSGDGWTTSGIAAAPPMALTGIEVGDTTPVLGLRGAVVDEGTGLKVEGFRVTVKNLSTDRAVAAVTGPDEAGYRLTVVDIETGRAATIGDTLEISAQSLNPFIGVEPLRYTVTAEDVKQSLIQLPELVAYEIPAETELLHNYPNPFNPETWIPYRLAEDAFVTLTIYDQTGQVVRTIDVGYQIASVYESRSKAIYWDGRNGLGETVASGVYFYHLSAGDYSATRKMLILK